MEHRVVSREEWLAARERLLEREKEITRMRDEIGRRRRELPWVKVEKRYVFDTPEGAQTLADLFAGRSQLIVYHFMFAPGWKEGCPGCSFLADHVAGALPHLEHHDVSLVVVSRAPRSDFEPFRRRMGWRFRWVSSFGGDFNGDYGVSFTREDLAKGPTAYNYRLREEQSEGEAPGVSVFYRNDRGEVFHTYSAYARGAELLIGAYNYLDLTPKGRNETGPGFNLGDWVRHHDKYDDEPKVGGGAARAAS